MTEGYCCEIIKMAIEDWRGVEYKNGYWYIVANGKEIEVCPWCKNRIKPPND